MFVLFCACGVMNMLSVKKMKIYIQKKKKEKNEDM
jgi:cellobiose-specific phosphotransferase system component IIB